MCAACEDLDMNPPRPLTGPVLDAAREAERRLQGTPATDADWDVFRGHREGALSWDIYRRINTALQNAGRGFDCTEA
jgi:hypothetical protein